jgi:hypothetical protein
MEGTMTKSAPGADFAPNLDQQLAEAIAAELAARQTGAWDLQAEDMALIRSLRLAIEKAKRGS